MTFRLERIALPGHSYALVAPGQCNKAPRGRQRDAGACSILRKDGVNPRAQRRFDVRQESTREYEREGQA